MVIKRITQSLYKSRFPNGHFLLEIGKKRSQIMTTWPQDTITGCKCEWVAKCPSCDHTNCRGSITVVSVSTGHFFQGRCNFKPLLNEQLLIEDCLCYVREGGMRAEHHSCSPVIVSDCRLRWLQSLSKLSAFSVTKQCTNALNLLVTCK